MLPKEKTNEIDLNFLNWFLNRKTVRFYQVIGQNIEKINPKEDLIFNISGVMIMVTSRLFSRSVYYVYSELLEEFHNYVQK